MTGGVSHEVSSPHYPQSNGKAEATVKSMKKLISAAWTDRQLTGPNSPEYCCNTATLPHGRMAYHRHKNLFGHPVQDTLPAHRRSFAPEWQKSTSEAESLDEKQQRILPEFTTNKHNPFPTYKWETMLPSSTQRDTYGVITAIGPYRKHFLKTQSGRVLFRNRRFIRKRYPISFPAPTPAITDPTPEPPVPPPGLPVPPPGLPVPPSLIPRRSTRVSHRAVYVAEDTKWMSSSSENFLQELGGEV